MFLLSNVSIIQNGISSNQIRKKGPNIFFALCFLAARMFKIVLKEGDKAKFYDNFDTPISENLLPTVLKTFHRSGSFYVNILFKFDDVDEPSIVTPFVSHCCLFFPHLL